MSAKKKRLLCLAAAAAVLSFQASAFPSHGLEDRMSGVEPEVSAPLPGEIADALPREAEALFRDGVLPEGQDRTTGYGADSGESGTDSGGTVPGTGPVYGAGTEPLFGAGTGPVYGTGTGPVYGAGSLTDGVGRILSRAGSLVSGVFRQRLRGIASILLAVVLCSAARGMLPEERNMAVSLAGALAVTALSAGSLEDFIGMGWNTIRELDTFSRALLPALAAATAASGSPTTATMQQVLGMFLAEALLYLINTLLMPLTYLYIGVLTASCALEGDHLALLAAGLKRAVSGILTTALLGFTIYLSVSRVLSGAADGAAVRIARAAVSGMVPVVGGILAEASEAVLAGAGMLKNSIGVVGMLAVLAACAAPFVQLGIQYLLYKAAAFLAAAVGMPDLCRLLDGLGGAFALVLGMTASCALLLLVSVLCFVSAVTPG